MDQLEEMVVESVRHQDWAVESILPRDEDVAPCVGCFKCWIETPGKCIIDDAARQITGKIIKADVDLTPLAFSGYYHHLKQALDRSISLVSPFFTRVEGEIHLCSRS